MKSTRHPVRFLVLAISLTLAAPCALADGIPELHSLVEANDSVAAWEMAVRMEPEHAGDPEFDFWYGLAAKAAGKNQQAVFAFERVVLVQPGNARAKLELADAYYRMGNHGEARRLFEDVLATTPPDPVQQRIRTYLNAMGAAEESRKTRVTGHATVAAGYDSNISSATDVVNHSVDISGVPFLIQLSPLSLAEEAGFAEFRGGVDIVQPVNQRDVRFLGISAQRRDNEDVFSGGNFDYSALGITGGWMLRRGTATWRIPFNVQGLWAESESTGIANDDRYSFSAGLEYSRPLSAKSSVVWFGQAGNAHVPSDENRNLWQVRLGGGYNWIIDGLPVRMSTIAMVGTEPAEESGVLAEVNGRDYAALRLTASWRITPVQSLTAALGAQASKYHESTFFSTWGEREEVLADASLGWQWQMQRNWTLNADLSHADNASRGTALYDYSRTQFKLGSTWRF